MRGEERGKRGGGSGERREGDRDEERRRGSNQVTFNIYEKSLKMLFLTFSIMWRAQKYFVLFVCVHSFSG
jgi:hypothetical protein